MSRAFAMRATAAAAFALMAAAPLAQAATSEAAAPAPAAAPQSVTVRPGQSLNDIAIAVTQSHDPAVLGRAGRALFAANPQAFMKHDPSRMRLGATLNVPPLDATGAAIAAPVSAPAAAAASASGAASVATAAVTKAAGASAPAAPAAAATAGSSAAHAASPAAPAGGSTPHAANAVSGAVAAGASAPAAAPGASAASVAPSSSAAPQAAPAAAAPHATLPNGGSTTGSTGPHSWSGSIQTAPPVGSSEAEAALLAPGSGARAVANGSDASAAQARPSSLQQLLALKNRVLMDLQKHGIGKPAPEATAPEAKPAPVAAPQTAGSAADAASGASEPATAASSPAASAATAPAAKPAAAQPSAPAVPVDRTAMIAIGVAAAALILGFLFRRRKRAEPEAEPQPEKTTGNEADTPPPAPGAAALAAGAAERPPAPVETPVAVHDVPPAPAHREAPVDAPVPVAPIPEAAVAPSEPAEPESAAPAAEPAAHDMTPDAVAPQPGQPDYGTAPAPLEAAPVAPVDLTTLTELNELTSSASSGVPTHEFPADAISALDSLDMPLPPRTGVPGATFDFTPHNATNSPSTSTLPAFGRDVPASPAASQPAGQAGSEPPRADLGSDYPDDELPLDDDAAAPAPANRAPAGFGSLGAAQFGALNLDFDLDLPVGPSASIPPPSEAALDRIAHNKLELAAEYVELGDLNGARALLGEVIDANRPGTHEAARAMLAKLADAT
ncbi:MAG: FimV/HubP family polar landmark protein [Burkholderia gladioli]